jgi:hypothetical protein
MNTPERMEVMMRANDAEDEGFNLALLIAAWERRTGKTSRFVSQVKDVILMRKSRLGRYLEAVAR